MKPLRSLIAIAAIAATFAAAAARGQEPAAPAAPAAPFTLILTGTRHAGDVEAIRQNLLRQPNVVSLTPSAASQGRLEFEGRFTGAASDLVTDVRGIAVDRFDVTVHDDGARGLVLTLRKFREDFGSR